MALRMFVESVLSVPMDERERGLPVAMSVSLRDFLKWLYPTRTPSPAEYWPRLMSAVEALDSWDARIPLYDPQTVPRQLYLPVWRQSVLPVHLLGLAPLLGSVGPVAGDVKLQDDGVVHDPVNRRGGGHGVGEDALPLREDQV